MAIQATAFCDNPTLKAASRALRKSSASRPRRGAGSGAGRHHDCLRLLPPVAGASLGATFFFSLPPLHKTSPTSPGQAFKKTGSGWLPWKEWPDFPSDLRPHMFFPGGLGSSCNSILETWSHSLILASPNRNLPSKKTPRSHLPKADYIICWFPLLVFPFLWPQTVPLAFPGPLGASEFFPLLCSTVQMVTHSRM